MKNHLREKRVFHLMGSGAKPTDLRSNMIEKRYRGIRRAPHFFFEFFLAIILFEIIAIVCEKIVFFPNLAFGDLWLPQY